MTDGANLCATMCVTMCANLCATICTTMGANSCGTMCTTMCATMCAAMYIHTYMLQCVLYTTCVMCATMCSLQIPGIVSLEYRIPSQCVSQHLLVPKYHWLDRSIQGHANQNL